MTTPTDRELVHASIDGSLTDAEAADLRERLAEDAALRAEADRLRQLAGLVDSLGPSDPPLSFADRVMELVAHAKVEPATWRQRARARLDQLLGRVRGHSQQEPAKGAVIRWSAGWAGGGDIVAKKVLWAVAGLAVVIILGVVYFNGTRTVDQGAQGTIGGAERYRGVQPASVAVTEGDVQKFLQSDTFDRIIKDKNVRHLLSDPALCAQLAGDNMESLIKKKRFAEAEVTAIFQNKLLAEALDDAGAVAALGNVNIAAAFGDAEVAALSKAKAFQAAMEDADAAAFFAKKKVMAAFADAALLDAAVKGNKAKLSADADLAAAMANAKFKAMVQDPAFAAAARNAKFQAMVADPAFAEAIGRAKFRAMMADQSLAAAMGRAQFQAMFADAAFTAAVKNPAFRKLITDASFGAAMQNGDFVEAFTSNAAFKASLSQTSLLDAALKTEGK
jgi:hypothetical protein